MLLLRYLKSYLPAHSILRGFVALRLCDFADAVRAGCAEAKHRLRLIYANHTDAIRAGCAEAKINRFSGFVICLQDAIRAGCAEAKFPSLLNLCYTVDAIRAGCAEAKWKWIDTDDEDNRCNPCGMC